MSNKSQASSRNALYDPGFYIQQLQTMSINKILSERGGKEAELNAAKKNLADFCLLLQILCSLVLQLLGLST